LEKEQSLVIDNACYVLRKNTAVSQLKGWTEFPFQHDATIHEDKLMRLWRNLQGDRRLKNRKSMEWVDIGFQGKDPATDFRGAGIFGLENLLAVTDEGSPFRSDALKFFKDS